MSQGNDSPFQLVLASWWVARDARCHGNPMNSLTQVRPDQRQSFLGREAGFVCMYRRAEEKGREKWNTGMRREREKREGRLEGRDKGREEGKERMYACACMCMRVCMCTRTCVWNETGSLAKESSLGTGAFSVQSTRDRSQRQLRELLRRCMPKSTPEWRRLDGASRWHWWGDLLLIFTKLWLLQALLQSIWYALPYLQRHCEGNSVFIFTIQFRKLRHRKTQELAQNYLSWISIQAAWL